MNLKKIIGIAACDPRGVIGNKGTLPWNCPEDLKHFRQTIGKAPIIMGHTTYRSLPSDYFNERLSFVFTRQSSFVETTPNIIPIRSLDQFLTNPLIFTTAYVIGGAQIYRLFLEANLISTFILTIMNKKYQGDTILPLSLFNQWPRILKKEAEDFKIYQYDNPLKNKGSR